MSKYSGVIIAKNNASTISPCIKALLALTDDVIVVLDDASTDDTGIIAADVGAKVYKKKWEGYSVNKNFGVEKAQNDWILCPDADEVFDDVLINNLKKLDLNSDHVYELNILTFFGKIPVKHCGWFPDWNIRLFNKNVMRWNSNFVHEHLVSDKRLKRIRVDGLILHYSFEGEKHMKAKFDEYARLRANEWIRSGKSPSFIKQLLGPSFRFFRTYILKLGILDGNTGWIIAKNEYFLKKNEIKIWKQMQKNTKI